jgi:hypothetical protein
MIDHCNEEPTFRHLYTTTLEERLQDISAVNATFQTKMSARLDEVSARQSNAAAMEPADSIAPVVVAGNPVPAVLPLTREELTAMTVQSTNILLNYCGLSLSGDKKAKNRKLLLHLGLRLRTGYVDQ